MEQKKKLHPLLIAVIMLLVLALGLIATVAGMWFYGKNAVKQTDTTPILPPQENEQEQPEQTADVIEYNGKRYEYNTDMYNVLLLGIDSDDNPADAAGNYDQADVLVLAALNLRDNKMTLISLSRDIMCDIALTNSAGELTSTMNTQLALAYAYGDGQHRSCELTRDAVSNIFYGLPIQGYGAYYVNGIAELNDAVGGITVNLIYDYPFFVCTGAERLTAELEGKDVTLTGLEAKAYIQMRPEEQADANELRMVRQKQYMLALISKAKSAIKENPASILKMYNAVDDYVLTNMNLSEITYLATQAATMDFTGDIRSVSGELTVNEESMAEVHVDREKLYNLMLDVFYSEL